MKKIITLTLFICQLIAASFAQAPCGFDEINEKLLGTDPQYAKKTKANEEYIQQYISHHPLSAQQTTGTLYTIPIVIHVVHTGGNIGTIYNPSDAQLLGAVDYLNKVYNGTHPSLNGGVGDMQIQFVLAKRDPNCNATTGIDRVDGSSLTGYVTGGINRSASGGATELSVKNLSRWNPVNYYNVWIVNKIDGEDGTSGQFTAGFAYFPSASSTLDGATILATQMKDGSKVFPHEIGHALNIYHPFQGSSGVGNCPANTICTSDGDKVCDTDPISYNSTGGVITFTCRTGTNSCTGTLYSINTERNFMNYTNCFTLFTAGQKERALAAMTLSNRISLANSSAGTPPSEGAEPCPPKINFETSSLTVKETSSGIVNCIKYTDYTINMTILSNPVATATATLQLGGTTTNLTDYQVTTNGDFTSPSLVLTFPSGSHNTQSFTVRVFNDAASELTETIIFNFTIDNGGGDAIKGNTSTLTIKIEDDDNDNVYPTIGIGNFNNFSQPFSSTYQKSRTQAIYHAPELLALGLKSGSVIAGIGLNVTAKRSSVPYTGFNIKLKNTTTDNFTSSGFETGTTNVYSNNYSTIAGENLINFTAPFIWDGTSNLLVEFCYDKSTTSSGSDSIKSTIQTVANCVWNRAPTGIGCSLIDQFEDVNGTFVRPDLTLIIQKSIATNLNTSKTEYLGPNAEVYFRSNDSIIARIKNLSSFDYGCTTIQIDRAGTGAVNFWNNNAGNSLASKTFRVIPTNNNPNGQYDISLYYSTSEINGWQTATGQSFNSIQLIKTSGAIAGITPATPNGSGIIDIATSIRDSVTNGKTITATFNTGFSGFGVGVLITTFYTFTGTGNWNTPANWTNGSIPPTILPSGSEIIINPVNDGECILNVSQTISQGALLNVLPGKKLTIVGNLQVD